MHEEGIQGGQDARMDESPGQKNAHWQIRCSPAQKEFLQSAAYRSGTSVAEFLVLAAQEALPKDKATQEMDKERAEAQTLLERLSALLDAKFVLATEKQLQAQAERVEMTAQKERVEHELHTKKEEFEAELSVKRTELESTFTLKEEQWEKALKDVDKAWEEKWLRLKEIHEQVESELSLKKKDLLVREKQYADSVRLHENIEEKNFELKAQNEQQKKELMELRNSKNLSSQTISQLEKHVSELIHQQEIQKIRQEEELKRLEKEYEFKFKLAELEMEKRFLSEKF